MITPSAPPQKPKNSKRRRLSVEFWSRAKEAIDREARVLARMDPSSPRVRPTLASFTPTGGAR